MAEAQQGAAVEFDAKLLQVLTSGDEAHMEELLSREDHGNSQTDDEVVISVQDAAPPRPGASGLLCVTNGGNTALHLVATRGHVGLAVLVCAGVPSLVVARNWCLDMPLHCAAKAGHREVAACLLSKMRTGTAAAAAALQARNRLGATALYETVRHGRAGVAGLLMTEAPELAVTTGGGPGSPLYLADVTGSVEMVGAPLRRHRISEFKPSVYFCTSF